MTRKGHAPRPDHPKDAGGEDYNFIRETIKKKPMDKKILIRRIAVIVLAAVLFGVCAAVSFAVVYPLVSDELAKRKGPDKVDIDVDQPSEEEAEPEPTATPQVVEVPRSITLEDYENIYTEIRQVAEEPMNAMVTVTGVARGENLLDNSDISYGQSSGVIIAKNSSEIYVLTTKAALDEGAKRAQITFRDGTVARGTLKKTDSGTGLAVVAVPAEKIKKSVRDKLTVAELGNSYSLMQGKPVIAIGSPTGYNEAVVYGNIVSVANRVSVVDAEYNLLVTDITGSHAGSGVLLDTDGSVIGILTGNLGDSSDSTVKALSVAQLKSLLAALSNGEPIRYAGIYGQSVSEGVAEQTGIPQGIYVDSVEADSPAMVAGIQSADVLTGFNGEEIFTMQKFATELQKCSEGARVPITAMRRGDEGYVEMQFEITIGVR